MVIVPPRLPCRILFFELVPAAEPAGQLFRDGDIRFVVDARGLDKQDLRVGCALGSIADAGLQHKKVAGVKLLLLFAAVQKPQTQASLKNVAVFGGYGIDMGFISCESTVVRDTYLDIIFDMGQMRLRPL